MTLEMMERIRVANVRTLELGAGEVGVYVGRGRALAGLEAGGLGNPLRVGSRCAQGEAADAYLPYLRTEYRKATEVRARLDRLATRLLVGERLALVCWCDPQPCHARHLRDAVLGVAAKWGQH